MVLKKKKSLTDAQQNLENLRNKLVQHQFTGKEPPTSLLVELKMAEFLVKLESINTMRVRVGNTKRIDIKV